MADAVFDTNILIDYLRGLEESHALLERVKGGEISGYVSVLTVAELVAGKDAERPDKKNSIWDLLEFFSKINVDEGIARASGDIRRAYEISIIDSVIAATASSLGCNLLTLNTKDFGKMNGITVEKPY